MEFARQLVQLPHGLMIMRRLNISSPVQLIKGAAHLSR